MSATPRSPSPPRVPRHLICAGNGVIIVTSNVHSPDYGNCHVTLISSNLNSSIIPIGIGSFVRDLIVSVVFVNGRFVMRLTSGRILISCNGRDWNESRSRFVINDGCDYMNQVMMTVNNEGIHIQQHHDNLVIHNSECGIHWFTLTCLPIGGTKYDTITCNGFEFILHPHRLNGSDDMFTSLDMRTWRSAKGDAITTNTGRNTVMANGNGCFVVIGQTSSYIRHYNIEKVMRQVSDFDNSYEWMDVTYCDEPKMFVAMGVRDGRVAIATLDATAPCETVKWTIRAEYDANVDVVNVRSMCCVGDAVAFIINNGEMVIAADVNGQRWRIVYDNGHDMETDDVESEVVIGRLMTPVSEQCEVKRKGGFGMAVVMGLMIGIVVGVMIGVLLGVVIDEAVEVVYGLVADAVMRVIRPM